MISVIVPVYNAEKTLNQCVDSVLSQKYKDFELLLINDGSKDKSGEICDKYALTDNRVRVFHQTNQGVSVARNIGIQNALGEWIAFVDSDDTINPDYCNIIDKTNADLIIFSWCSKYNMEIKDKYIFKDLNFKQNIGDIFSLTNIGYMGFPWGKIYKRKIITNYNLKFNELLSISEDRLFFYEYLLYTRQVVFKSYLGYNYSLSEYSLSKKMYSYDVYKYRFIQLDRAAAKVAKTLNLNRKSIQPLLYFQILYICKLIESRKTTTILKDFEEFKIFFNGAFFQYSRISILYNVKRCFGNKFLLKFIIYLIFFYVFKTKYHISSFFYHVDKRVQ